jgi:hypothetical protein
MHPETRPFDPPRDIAHLCPALHALLSAGTAYTNHKQRIIQSPHVDSGHLGLHPHCKDVRGKSVSVQLICRAACTALARACKKIRRNMHAGASACICSVDWWLQNLQLRGWSRSAAGCTPAPLPPCQSQMLMQRARPTRCLQCAYLDVR